MKELNKNKSLNDKIVDFVSDNIVWVFLFFIVVVIVLPRLFILVSPIGYFDNLKPDELGNAIGGMTAPIVGLISAFLIYVAFSAQVKANKELIKLSERDSHIKELNNLFSLLDKLETNTNKLTLTAKQFDKNNLEIDENFYEIESISCIIWNFYGKNTNLTNSKIFDHFSNCRRAYYFLSLFMLELDKCNLNIQYNKFFLKQVEKYNLFIDEELLKGIESMNGNFHQNVQLKGDSNFRLYKVGYKNIRNLHDNFIKSFDSLSKKYLNEQTKK
jgi:hypothetical protein